MIASFLRRYRVQREINKVSEEWIRDLERQGNRIEFHGVSWAWPVKDLVKEIPALQTRRAKKTE